MGESTLYGIKLHFRHIAKTLGERFPIQELALPHLQQHVDRRAKMKGQRGKLSPATIRKELVTLRTVWNWGVQMKLVTGPFPSHGLTFPKFHEKPPFQTAEEIRRRIAAGGLKPAQIAELWDALYLTLPEIDEILQLVRDRPLQPWFYAMLCFAAHTGARRAEMLRAQVSDVDFAGQTVLIREKKRARGKTTTRRIPLTPFLAEVLREWLGLDGAPQPTTGFSKRPIGRHTRAASICSASAPG